jgi:hypothetical protein
LEEDHPSNFGLNDDEDIISPESFPDNSCDLKCNFSVSSTNPTCGDSFRVAEISSEYV